jgi:hypothetical protein
MLTTVLLIIAFVFLLCGARSIIVWGFNLGWVGLALWLLVVILGGR